MKVYEVTISYRFDADNADHAIEQFLDVVIHTDHRHTPVDQDVESAITNIRELKSRSDP